MKTWRSNLPPVVLALLIGLTLNVELGATKEPPQEVETPMEKLRRTLQGLRALATAVEGYSIDNNRYPRPKCEPHPSGLSFCSAYDLGADLKVYSRGVSASDNWGNPYWYWHTPDGKHYALVSTGSDGSVDDPSHMQELLEACAQADGFIKPRFADCFESDLVWCDGQGLQTAADVVKTCR